MDLLHRKDQITAGQDNLRKMVGTPSPVSLPVSEIKPITAPTRRLQEIIDQVRDVDQKRYGYFRYVLLASALIIVGSLYNLQGGAIIDSLILALSYIIYLWIAHRLMRSLRAKNNLDHGVKFLPMVVTEEMDHQKTVARTLAVIELGQRRLLLVTICYFVFFPVFLVLVYATWIEMANLRPYYFWAWSISLTLNAISWYVYDNTNINRNDELIDSLKRLVW